MTNALSTNQLLKWYVEAGVDETIGDEALNRYAIAKESQPAPQLKPAQAQSKKPDAKNPAPKNIGPKDLPPKDWAQNTEKALSEACKLAASAQTMEELHNALKQFDGCALKKTATNMVFGDGDIAADVILIGEAPGADEDRQGIPFAGASGELLNNMLTSIDLDKTKVFTSNIVFWRPPGDRSPTPAEMAVCMPFVERMIELIDPKILITLGAAASKSMLAQTSTISRLRGKWFTYATPRLSRPVQASAIFHPKYLLSTPAQKREAWNDLRMIKQKLNDLKSGQG